jgi:hypothetical protein
LDALDGDIKEREINKVSLLETEKREKEIFLQKNFVFSLFGFSKKILYLFRIPNSISIQKIQVKQLSR